MDQLVSDSTDAQMTCAFVTGSVSRNAGGIFDSMRNLGAALKARGVSVVVFGVRDRNTTLDIDDWRPLAVNVFPIIGPERFGYGFGLNSALRSQCVHLLHSHGLWNHTSVVASRWHRQTRRPYIVHPHGMLDGWALRKSRNIKRMARVLYEQRHLRGAACIRALNEAEVYSIRAFGLKNPVCVVPNGIELPTPAQTACAREDRDFQALRGAGYRILLYLGRIHPKKGLIQLLLAWKRIVMSRRAQDEGWALLVAGWGENGHERQIIKVAAELGILSANISNEKLKPEAINGTKYPVVFLGPRFGKARMSCYRNSSAFILPSLSEGLPMTVLEAWSFAKPVLMTEECNLPEGFTRGAAVRLKISALEDGLHQLIDMSDSERQTMGASGLRLVTDRFSWDRVATDIESVSQWALGGGARPNCVQLRG